MDEKLQTIMPLDLFRFERQKLRLVRRHAKSDNVVIKN